MSVAPRKLLTPQEYLAQERKADFRSEYYRGEVFAMAGASYEHTLVKDNLARELGILLKGGPCKILTSDMRVKIDTTGLYTYPDAVIVCDKPQFEDKLFDTLLNPRMIVEVLSDSTETYDRGKKFAHYRQIPSLQEYLLIAQDEPTIERYVRQSDGTWSLKDFNGIDAALELTSVPVRLQLAEIYAGIEFGEKAKGKSV